MKRQTKNKKRKQEFVNQHRFVFASSTFTTKICNKVSLLLSPSKEVGNIHGKRVDDEIVVFFNCLHLWQILMWDDEADVQSFPAKGATMERRLSVPWCLIIPTLSIPTYGPLGKESPLLGEAVRS